MGNMRQMKMKRADLIEALKKNLDTHRDTFLKAQIAYKQAVIDEFEIMLKNARGGACFARSVSCPIPEDHSGDYRAAILMLEMSVDDEIEISADDFNQLVMDDWGWKQKWSKTTSSYV